ncbi:hypothetical protein BDL97_12G103800 [Sphagnum fallax]|nr:hypothetical protein BDL97_12G103800 [Sphagnum fallax]
MDKQMGVWTVKLLLIAVLKALVCSLYILRGVSGIQGSIFVDCGSNASYVDKITNISWVPDAQYITAGENRYVASAQSIYPNFSEFTTMRYFPDSTAKNCYSFPAITNQTYQIRGTFFYGFYDNAMTTPSFQMGIDGTIVANVTFNDAATFVYYEFSYVSQLNTNKTFLCLLRDSSNSIPFISAISFSPLPNDSFYSYSGLQLYEGYYLQTKYRLNFGGNRFVRYPDDSYDQYWYPEGSNSTFLESTTPPPQILMTNHNIDENMISPVLIPEAVIDTALTTTNGNITIIFPDNYTYNAVVIFYYAELDATANATSRQFYLQPTDYPPIVINPIVDASKFTVSNAGYLDVSYVAGWDIVLYQDQTIYSPLGPLVNALEVLEISENFMTILTNHEDALAIENIKLSYTNLVNWTGDPCVPTPHPWLTCRTSDTPPTITQVDLSGYNLVGPISPNFGDLSNLISLALQHNELNGSLPQQLTRLTNLRNLQLQNNILSGELPAWLDSLPSLTELLIQNNNFSGPISPSFISHNGTWTFIPGNPMLGLPTSKSTNIGIIIGPIIGILALLIIIGVIFYFQVQNKRGKTTKTSGHLQMMKSSHQGAKFYSLAEVIVASDNFKTLIGKGGFGHVYYGKLEDGHEVAIKVLDVKSTQGPSEFFNEVHVLSRVSHRNLVSLIGYCHEDNQQMLIYEFMHEGSLRDHLYGDIAMLTVEKLDWKSRMNIALNAAQGLEYLHSGSNQSIIHRDVKSNNILLSSNMEIAKVADFGLSRLIYGKDGITHVTTDVKGTIGYLDPEYFLTEYLSTKSDVYGFGVLLLEIISGRMPIDSTLPNRNAWNLCEWVRSNLQAGNIDRILDPIVKASNPQIDVLWKVAEIAIQCVEPKSIYRPTMTKVVEELRAAILQEGLNSSEYSQNDTYGIQDEYGSQINAFDPR